jgi:hypothetical protein
MKNLHKDMIMKLLATMMILATVAFAADFGHMSTEEMMQMRGSVPAEQRADFQAEMQKRMQNMTPQERQKYMADRPGMKNKQQHQNRGMQPNMMGGQGGQHQQGKGMKGNKPMMNQNNMNEGMKCGAGMSR